MGRFCIVFYSIGMCGRRVIDSKICSDYLCCIIAADTKQSGNKINHIAMGMTSKAIEMLVQLQTGGVIFVKGTVGHTVASYIHSIHLSRIQCGDGFFDPFVYGHVVPFHLICVFSFSSAIIITAPGGGHGAGRLWRKTVIALMLPVSGQLRASSSLEERLSKYHCVLQAVFAFGSYRLLQESCGDRWDDSFYLLGIIRPGVAPSAAQA